MSALLLGAGTGFGLLLILTGLLPAKPSLAQTLALALSPPPARGPAIVAREQRGWASRAGSPAAATLAGYGLPRASVRRNLAVLGRPVEEHLGEQAVCAVLGLLTPPVLVALLTLAGIHIAILIPVWVALALAVLGFFTPDLGVAADATARRADFRHALSNFLDLVVISLAGGAGVEGALDDASSVGTGWAFTQIRRALASARVSRVAPWQALGRLGEELGISELAELAASISLAGSEGAKVRTSLAAKAAALRGHQLNAAEAHAQSATERMSVPVVVLFAGFLAFIAYPAMATVLTTL